MVEEITAQSSNFVRPDSFRSTNRCDSTTALAVDLSVRFYLFVLLLLLPPP